MSTRRELVARGLGGLVTLASALAIVFGSAAHTATNVVHHELLQPGMYTRAFAEQDVYRRLYSDVLTDPAVRDVTDSLLGGLTIDGVALADTPALSIALTRLALPPTRLRQIGDTLTADVLAYLRGHEAELSADVDLSTLVSELDETVTVVIRDQLAHAATRILADLPAYESAVQSFATDLANGIVPDAIPVVGGRAVSEDQIMAVIDAAAGFGMSTPVRDQVMAAVRSGEERDALITASTALVRIHLEGLVTSLAEGNGLQIDIVDALGRAAGQPQRRAVAELNSIRESLRWAPSWAEEAGLALVLLGVCGAAALHRRHPARAVLVIGAACVVGSSAISRTWTSVSSRFDSPLTAAVAGGRRNGLPPSVRSLVTDVDGSLREQLRAVVNRDSDRLFVIGVSLVAVALTPATVAFARRLGHALAPSVATAARRAPVVVAASLLPPAALVGGLLVSRSPAAAPETVRACNGHVELCDRPYNRVVQVATHNSMSSPDDVLIWPEHDGDIRTQLEAGVRTLLIDTHYWTAVESPAELSTLEQSLPADVANALFAVLGSRLDAHPGTYLCHSRCAYGAIPLAQSLSTVRDFLDKNPDDVVTLIIQNGITTADTEEAFTASGLDDYVYDGTPDGDWPTLGELVDSDKRLVVIAERPGPGPSWYHDGRDILTDTSFDVTSPAGFSCSRQRGDPGAPLSLLNHWIDRQVPDRADAAIVNQRAFIVDRARQCERITGRLPTFIAVDFFSIGDVFRAVDELNGIFD